mmetsp:Transcript_20294/g.66022  ORF Transcript_20294/g.66022 Transcript_20294/m.66022 type:complete len:80 (+) Transcript_20294:77-316(+)
MLRNGMMESRIEYCYMRNIRQMLFGGSYPLQIRRIMKRRNIKGCLNSFLHIFIDKNRIFKCFTTVHYSVTYSFNFIQRM